MSDDGRASRPGAPWTAPGPWLDGALVVACSPRTSSRRRWRRPTSTSRRRRSASGRSCWRRSAPARCLAARCDRSPCSAVVLALVAIASRRSSQGCSRSSAGRRPSLALYASASWSEPPPVGGGDPRRAPRPRRVGLARRRERSSPQSLAAGLALVVLPWVLGYAARTRRLYLVEVEHRLAEAERQRDDPSPSSRARGARPHRPRAPRRRRPPREPHRRAGRRGPDRARPRPDDDPGRARGDRGVEPSGGGRDAPHARRAARRRRPTPLAPQPGLADLDRLVARFRDAGIDVVLRCRGTADALPPLLELCCYRIVEEALTNVTRHSAATTVHASTSTGASTGVRDRGRAIPARPRRPGTDTAGGAGRHAERVALFGGTLAVGPTPTAGSRSWPRCPLDAAARP